MQHFYKEKHKKVSKDKTEQADTEEKLLFTTFD